MPKKIPQLLITVEAPRCAEFPLDMLRYDCGSPATESDSASIRRSVAGQVTHEDPPRRQVRVFVRGNGAPTAARWESFGWRVVSVTINGVVEPYQGQRIWK